MHNIEKLRAETPGLQYVTHFNNAGAALMPQPVISAMQDHIELEAKFGGYEAAKQAQPQLQNTYKSIARLINAHPDEIAILENATRAWTMAFYGIEFKDGDRILSSVAEYASNYIAFLQVKKRVDISIEIIPNDAYGQVDVNALANMMDERVRLIAISHVPSQGGLIQPAAEIGAIANEYGAWYLLDACQSIGQLQVDVKAIGCHMLSATGRKYLRGPRGIGFLYVSQSILQEIEPPLLDLHSATWLSKTDYTLKPTAIRFENWEANIAAKIGLGVAVDYVRQVGIEAIETRVLSLANTFRGMLSEIEGVTIRDMGKYKCGIVTFTVENRSADDIHEAFQKYKINTSLSRRSTAVMDLGSRGIESVVRASLHYYLNQDDLQYFCDTLGKII